MFEIFWSTMTDVRKLIETKRTFKQQFQTLWFSDVFGVYVGTLNFCKSYWPHSIVEMATHTCFNLSSITIDRPPVISKPRLNHYILGVTLRNFKGLKGNPIFNKKISPDDRMTDAATTVWNSILQKKWHLHPLTIDGLSITIYWLRDPICKSTKGIEKQ